jgi:hypothetical protein
VPDWTPNWDDVAFDHGAAATAAAACRAAAIDADGVLDGLVLQRRPVTEDWTGRYRDDFAGEEGVVRTELARARAELVRLATAIEGASEAAGVEQRRRVAARERWREEVRAEHAREASMRAAGSLPR